MDHENGTSVPLPDIRDAVAEHIGKSAWIGLACLVMIIAVNAAWRPFMIVVSLGILFLANVILVVQRVYSERREINVWGDGDT